MWGHSPSLFPMRYRTLFFLYLLFYKLSAAYVSLVLRKRSAFRFNTALSESSSLSGVLHFRCSIYNRTLLFDANSVFVGLSGKFELLDSPSSVSDFIENNFLKDFNSFTLFIMQSWLTCKGHLVTFYLLKVFTLSYSVFRGNA